MDSSAPPARPTSPPAPPAPPGSRAHGLGQRQAVALDAAHVDGALVLVGATHGHAHGHASRRTTASTLTCTEKSAQRSAARCRHSSSGHSEQHRLRRSDALRNRLHHLNRRNVPLGAAPEAEAAIAQAHVHHSRSPGRKSSLTAAPAACEPTHARERRALAQRRLSVGSRGAVELELQRRWPVWPVAGHTGTRTRARTRTALAGTSGPSGPSVAAVGVRGELLLDGGDGGRRGLVLQRQLVRALGRGVAPSLEDGRPARRGRGRLRQRRRAADRRARRRVLVPEVVRERRAALAGRARLAHAPAASRSLVVGVVHRRRAVRARASPRTCAPTSFRRSTRSSASLASGTAALVRRATARVAQGLLERGNGRIRHKEDEAARPAVFAGPRSRAARAAPRCPRPAWPHRSTSAASCPASTCQSRAFGSSVAPRGARAEASTRGRGSALSSSGGGSGARRPFFGGWVAGGWVSHTAEECLHRHARGRARPIKRTEREHGRSTGRLALAPTDPAAARRWPPPADQSARPRVFPRASAYRLSTSASGAAPAGARRRAWFHRLFNGWMGARAPFCYAAGPRRGSPRPRTPSCTPPPSALRPIGAMGADGKRPR